MILRPYYSYDHGCAAYVFGCGTLGKCAVVDPGLTMWTRTLTFAGSKAHARHACDRTHVHADHRSGGRLLAERTGASYCVHESADIAMPFTPLRDGEAIELGNTHVTVLHTPGHSPDSMCLLVTDRKRGSDPWFVLTGDTLFVGAVGRPDSAWPGARERQ